MYNTDFIVLVLRIILHLQYTLYSEFQIIAVILVISSIGYVP